MRRSVSPGGCDRLGFNTARVFPLRKVLRNTRASAAAVHTTTHDAVWHKWTDVFHYRNMPLNIFGMLCWLTCLVVLSALFPS